MNKSAQKKPGYLSQVIKEISDLIDTSEDRAEVKEKLTTYIPDRILESYKNGIKAGRKQATQE